MNARLLAVALVPLCLLVSCADDDPDNAPDPAEVTVEVHFQDSSVPPEYHRSWQLTADQESVHVVVDSYGDQVGERTVKVPAELWDDFVESLPDELADIESAEGEDGCTGGTSTSLEVSGVDDGDRDSGDGCSEASDETQDDIADLVEPLTDLVDLDELTATD